jgi:hypothetical protein
VKGLHGKEADSNIASLLTLLITISPTLKTKSGNIRGVNKGTLSAEVDKL